mmetsp:Transcript_9555/g.14070  ORF Transcript_9555/g.14070 Transcript_9555/m.14070 type:complete len:90 (-) Transcript_9555:294-563(-)
MPPRVKKVTKMPINVIFSHLQEGNRIKVWLYEDTRMALEGKVLGFDEYMNMTLDNTVECDLKSGKRTEVGRILLKGDAITLIQNANPKK